MVHLSSRSIDRRTVSLALCSLLFAGACTERPEDLVAPPVASGLALVASSAGAPLELYPNTARYREQGAKPSTGRSGGVQLTARALIGKDLDTHLEVSTGDLDGSAAGTGAITKLQVKHYDGDGDLASTLNDRSFPASERVIQIYRGLARGATLQIQGNVAISESARTGVVTLRETVRLRPDLRVDITVPGTVPAKVPTQIAATVREANGDVGADASCALFVDGVEVDRATGIWVDAGDAVTCAFLHTFETAGTSAAEVRVLDVAPGDYDLANNSATATVTVSGASDFQYTASANANATTYWITWTSEYSTVTGDYGDWLNDYSRNTLNQSAVLLAILPQPANVAASRLDLGIMSGGRPVHAATLSGLEPVAGVACAARLLDGGWSVSLCSGGTPGSGWTRVVYYYSAGVVTYYSRGFTLRHYASTNHTDYWVWNDEGATFTGAPIVPFGTEVSFSLALTDSVRTYRTSPTVPLDTTVNRIRGVYVPWGCATDSTAYSTVTTCHGREERQVVRSGTVSGQP